MDNNELKELIMTRTTNSAGMLVENKQYIGVLKVALSDCEAIAGDISSTTFRINSLKKLITKYNNCVSPYVGAGYSVVLYAKHDSNHGYLFVTQHHGWNACIGLDYELFDFLSIFFDFGYQGVNSVGYDPKEKHIPPYDWLTLKTNVMSFRLGGSF